MRRVLDRPRSLGAALALVGVLVGASALYGQSAATFEPEATRDNAFPLTIQSIMRGPELVGQTPTAIRWSDDGRWLYFRWLPGGREWHADRELYRVPSAGGSPEPIDEETEEALAPLLGEGDVSPDGASRAVSSDGDLYLISRATGEFRRLTRTDAAEHSPVFSGDGASLFFREGRNLFAYDLADGAIRQLTNLPAGAEPAEEKEAEGQKAFLEKQQEELFEHVRVSERREAEREERRERREAARAKPLYLAAEEEVGALVPDPHGRRIALTAFKSEQAQRTDIPRWITATGYTENTEMRAKVGDAQGGTRLAVIETESGEAKWLDLVPDADDDLALATFVGWDDTGSHGLVFAVEADYKTWRLYAYDAPSGGLTLLDSLHDEAWVGGPCFAGFGGGCMGWLPASEAGSDGTPRAWYVSEETGYAHLYAIDADGSDKRALTSGAWEVDEVEIPEGWDAFLIHTSEVSPFDRHPWRLGFDGSRREQLLEGPGSFEITPSPDGSRWAVVHARANRPPEVFLAEARPAAALTQVTVSPTEAWLGFSWIEPEIVRFEARDGVRVPARIYRPRDLRAQPNGAGVVFVHGAGYLHNVHRWWSTYYREYMFHHFLAAQGYTVLDIDYRGSAGYGRDWRTAIYRHMGGKDLTDQIDGADYLVRAEGIDPDRLGIYGGSYGGFITLMAMFTHPGVFEAGAALRAVTDWAHYNHWYTSRILNLPDEDEEAYRRSSPIYFAEGLEGHLLIAHGMYDTNVHFSDVVRLAQRLIELGKENWEMAVYPVENHSFVEPSSWTDEYRRIYELFERVIGGGRDSLTQGAGG